MLGVKGKLRIYNVLLFLSLLIFLIVIMVVFIREDKDMVPYRSDLLKNIVKLNEVDLIYIIDNNTFVKLKAKTGDVDIIDYNIDMKHVDVLYTGKDFVINAQAERGEYLSQRFLKAYDNITGHMDNMTFKTGSEGFLEYDYIEGRGEVKNGVTITQDNNSISSKSIAFDIKNNFIIFKDNVTVDYIPAQE